MEKKTTAILLACIIAGAAGLTFGLIYMTRQEGMDQTVLLLAMMPPKKTSQTVFTSTWDTTKPGSSGTKQITLPLQLSGTYNFMVDWGDGNTDSITSWNQLEVTHNYSSQGVYTIKISGTLIGWRFNNGGDRLKLLEISKWGAIRLGTSGGYFYGCSNLNLTATDNLDLRGTKSLSQAFRGCTNLGDAGNINGWDVSSVTNMNYMFYGASSFNQNLSAWDVSSVIDTSYMFYFASSFNQDIGGWNVSSVMNMNRMFYGASSFNQSIGNWDVSSVATMYAMF